MNLKILLSFIALTIMFSALGQNNAAIDSLENVLRTAKEDTTKVNNLLELSYQYGKISEFKMARQNAESALELAKALDDKKGIARSNKFIGNCCEISGEFSKALEHFGASLKVFEEIGDKREIGFIYTNIGIIYQNMGKLPEALESSLASLKIFEEIGDKEGMAWSYSSIGFIYMNMHNDPEAIRHYSASLKISEEIGDKKGIATAYSQIGHIHLNQGNYDESLENLLNSLKISEEIGSRISAAGCNNNIGFIYWEQDNYPEAIKYFQASLKLTEEIGYDALTAYNYNCLADVNIAFNHFQEARKYLDDHLAFSKARSDTRGIVQSYIKIGILYYKQGNFQEARKYFDDGIALSKEIGSKGQIRSIYRHLSILDSAEGNFAQALEHYKMHTLYKDSLRNEEYKKQVDEMLIQYETEKKDREIELLNKDNQIKALQINQQEALLRTSRLEAEKNQNELLLMNNSMELQQLKLSQVQKDLERQQAEARTKVVELELMGKEKILTEQQLEKQRLVRNGTIAGAMLLLLVGLLLFRSFMLRKKLEKQQAILQERKRISSDLHDDVGAGLSKITLLSELLKTQAKTPENRKEAEKISETALQLSSTLSEIIWALNSNNDYLENMVAYIRRYAAEYFEDSPVKLNIVTQGKILPAPINGEHRRNIFYTVKEALNNILKHAEATEAELKFVVINDKLDVIISDNGKGIPDVNPNLFGNGIKNMRARMKSISGDFNIESHQGTRIILKLAI